MAMQRIERTFEVQLVKVETIQREQVEKEDEYIIRATLEGRDLRMTLERKDGHQIDLPLGELYDVVFRTSQTILDLQEPGGD